MNSNEYLFSSESVTEGHPDKICDQISDSILDAYLKEDPESRVACECLISKNILTIAGEISSKGTINIEKIAKKVLTEIGYTKPKYGFDTNLISESLNPLFPSIFMDAAVSGTCFTHTQIFIYPYPLFYP